MIPVLGLGLALALSAMDTDGTRDRFYGHPRRPAPDRAGAKPVLSKTKAKRTARQQAAKRARKATRRSGS